MLETMLSSQSIMRKFYLIGLFLVFAASSVYAQPRYRMFDFFDQKLKSWSVGIGAGLSAYNGDLSPAGNIFDRSKTFDKPYGNIGVFGRRRFNDYLIAGLNVNYYRIGSDDAIMSQSNGNLKRNLSFRSNNIEVLGTVNFEFFNYNTMKELSRSGFPFSSYLILGFGMTTNNPQANLDGTWYNLRDYQTEGVGYSKTALIVPLGLGLQFQVSKGINMLIESSYRFTNTDYLDDVSTSYSEEAVFSADPIRAALADRTPSVYNIDRRVNKKRGNPTKKDGYFLIQARVEYELGSGGFSGFKNSLKFKRKSKRTQKISN
jgi:hypothetical protein